MVTEEKTEEQKRNDEAIWDLGEKIWFKWARAMGPAWVEKHQKIGPDDLRVEAQVAARFLFNSVKDLLATSQSMNHSFTEGAQKGTLRFMAKGDMVENLPTIMMSFRDSLRRTLELFGLKEKAPMPVEPTPPPVQVIPETKGG